MYRLKFEQSLQQVHSKYFDNATAPPCDCQYS